MSEAILETVTALVGTKAIEAAMADLTPGTAVVTGDDIPFYPRLTVRRNAYSLRKLLTPAQQEYFWELLKVCGLRRSGWNVRKLKGDPGAQQLWALATGLMDRPEKLLAIEPMVGMAEADRQSFAALLRWPRPPGHICPGSRAVRFRSRGRCSPDRALRPFPSRRWARSCPRCRAGAAWGLHSRRSPCRRRFS